MAGKTLKTEQALKEGKKRKTTLKDTLKPGRCEQRYWKPLEYLPDRYQSGNAYKCPFCGTEDILINGFAGSKSSGIPTKRCSECLALIRADGTAFKIKLAYNARVFSYQNPSWRYPKGAPVCPTLRAIVDSLCENPSLGFREAIRRHATSGAEVPRLERQLRDSRRRNLIRIPRRTRGKGKN